MADKYDSFLDGGVSPSDKYDSFLGDQTSSTQKFTPTADELSAMQKSLYRGEHPVLAGIGDFLQGNTGIVRGIMNAPGKILDNFTRENTPSLGDRVFNNPMVRSDTVPAFVGSLTDPLGIALLGGSAAPVAKTAQAAARYLPKVGYLGKYGQGVATGAIGGGAVGALSDNSSAGEGAAVGGAATAVLSPVISSVLSLAAKGTPWAIDLLKGRLVDIKAGKILREVAGDELPKIRAALTAAGDDITASQAASGVGSTKWSALGQRASQNDSQYTAYLLARQAADRQQSIAGIAGGNTATAAKQAADSSKSTLNAITAPMRDAELGAANTAGELLGPLQSRANALGQAATNSVEDVRRLSAAQQIAEDRAQNSFGPGIGNQQPWMGGVRAPSRYTYADSLPQRADQAAGQAAQDSLLSGEGARFAQMQADSLAAHGLTPLNTDGIVSRITASMNNPKMAGSKPVQNVLSNVADQISQWTDANGGVIDAQALYSIRKNAVSAEVSRLNPGATEKAQAKMTASILGHVNPLIDDAIENAGGTGWRDYLKTYSDGMKVINQMKLGGKALEALNQSPDAFLKLVKGNNPKVVQKIFGSEYDISSAMGPQNSQVLQGVASQLERDKNLATLGNAGVGDVANILTKNASGLRLPAVFCRSATVANKALDVAENTLNRKVMERVYESMRNGKSAKEAIDLLPTYDKSQFYKALSSFTTVDNIQPYANLLSQKNVQSDNQQQQTGLLTGQQP